MIQIGRVLGWLTLAVLAALTAVLLHAGDPARPSWRAEGMPIALWAAAPLTAPWFAARRWPHVTMFAVIVLVLISAFAAWAYGDAFFLSHASTAALALIFVPLWQWAALLALGGLAMLRAILRRSTRSS